MQQISFTNISFQIFSLQIYFPNCAPGSQPWKPSWISCNWAVWDYTLYQRCKLQNKVQLCCILYQWFLHIVAVGDCVCPQMSVAKVKNCWLQDSYQTVPPIIITHTQHIFRQANFAGHYTPLSTKQKAFGPNVGLLIRILGNFVQPMPIIARPCDSG